MQRSQDGGGRHRRGRDRGPRRGRSVDEEPRGGGRQRHNAHALVRDGVGQVRLAGQIWLSPISIWEVLLLVEKGRLIPGMPARQWIAETMTRLPTREAPLTHDIA